MSKLSHLQHATSYPSTTYTTRRNIDIAFKEFKAKGLHPVKRCASRLHDWWFIYFPEDECKRADVISWGKYSPYYGEVTI